MSAIFFLRYIFPSPVLKEYVFVLAVVVYNSIGEESYSSGSRPPLTDSPTFIVDPIGKLSRYTFLPRSPYLRPPTPSELNRVRAALRWQMARPTLCTVTPTRAYPSA